MTKSMMKFGFGIDYIHYFTRLSLKKAYIFPQPIKNCKALKIILFSSVFIVILLSTVNHFLTTYTQYSLFVFTMP